MLFPRNCRFNGLWQYVHVGHTTYACACALRGPSLLQVGGHVLSSPNTPSCWVGKTEAGFVPGMLLIRSPPCMSCPKEREIDDECIGCGSFGCDWKTETEVL